MTLLLVSCLAFASSLALGTAVVRMLRDVGPLRAAHSRNALTRSALGPVVSLLAEFNRKPSLDARCRRLERKLIHAGRPGGPVSGEEFLAAIELAGLGSFLAMVAFFTLVSGLSFGTLILAFALAAFGMWAVQIWLDNAVGERKMHISRQFPYFLDLSVMTMDAGSSFPEAMEIYVRDNPEDALAEEIRLALNEIEMGRSLQDALDAIADRVDVECVQAVIKALLQSMRMGTPIAQALREQADEMRFRRSQSAERAAEQLKVKMQGPVMMMLMAVFLLILGPAFLSVAQSGIL